MDSDEITNGVCFRNDQYNLKHGKCPTSPLYTLRSVTLILFRRFRFPRNVIQMYFLLCPRS